jgi:transcription elongation factor GreA
MSKPYYISAEALEKLKNELEYLKKTKRKEIADKIQAAIQLGDLSENAEYHDAKDELGMLEGRISQMEDQVKNAVIIEEGKGDRDIIEVGCSVELEVDGQQLKYTIVGPNEADPAQGFISNETPLAEALMGHKAGDQVEFEAPAGTKVYKIISVK